LTVANQRENADSDTSSPSRTEPLRVGLLINSYLQPRWVHQVVLDIVTSTVATVVLVVKNDVERHRDQTLPEKLSALSKSLFYKLYSRIDAWLFSEKLDAFETLDIQPLLSKVPVVHAVPIQKKFSDELREEDIANISKYGLDVAIRFGFRILKGSILQLPRYGIWSFHHGDNMRYRGGPPGFWEVMEGNPVTGAVLQILSDELDNGRVIYRSYSATERFSVRRNSNRFYRQASASVLRKLRDLHSLGEVALQGDPTTDPQMYSRRLYKAPTNLTMLRLLTQLVWSYAAAKIENQLFFNQWFLAYKINLNENEADRTFYRFRRLLPPKDRFWADPFPLKKDGRYYIFFEELLFETQKGHLSVIEVDHEGIVGGPHKILERPHHLSYPFLFSWRGQLYMIPESGRAHVVELYRCTSFPDKWEREGVLLEGLHAVDATIAEIQGKWWMFTSVQVQNMKHMYELHLFHAESPMGAWEPHRYNPVKADGYSSRPAGGIFERNGVYYRPAQLGPGDGMVIYRIERLDIESYLETEVSRIEPEWMQNLVGTHTLNSSSGLTVIDGLLRRSR
jgi:hypothetical protein